MTDEVLVKAENVSKKFCRSLKRSMWYGLQDVAGELLGRKGGHDQLRKNEFWALDDVSFELRRGECLGLIGPNGAGKSTLLKMLNGLVKPDKGRITMRGRVGALIELGAGFNPILTARENIYVNGSVLGFTKKEIDRKFDAIVDFAELEEFIDTPVQSLSSGMKVRLGFAVAAQMEPDVLMIDEILAVGDAAFRTKCINAMAEIAKSAGIIFVSHSIPLIGRMSNQAMLLVKGKRQGVDLLPSEVVQLYLHSVEPQSQFEIGTDEVVLKNVTVNGTRSETHRQFSVNQFETLNIQLDFEVRDTRSEMIMNLSFVDAEEKNVLETFSNFSEFVLRPHGSQFTVHATMPSLDLNPGKYTLYLALIEKRPSGQRGKIVFASRGFAGLAVTGQQVGYAPVQQRVSWSMG